LRSRRQVSAIRKAKIDEFRWLAGEWAAEIKVRATPTTPSYTDTLHLHRGK